MTIVVHYAVLETAQWTMRERICKFLNDVITNILEYL